MKNLIIVCAVFILCSCAKAQIRGAALTEEAQFKRYVDGETSHEKCRLYNRINEAVFKDANRRLKQLGEHQ